MSSSILFLNLQSQPSSGILCRHNDATDDYCSRGAHGNDGDEDRAQIEY